MTKTQEIAKINLPIGKEIRNGEMSRDFRGRLAEGFARGVRLPIVSKAALKDRGRLNLEIGMTEISVYDVSADVWVSLSSPSRKNWDVNSVETARVFPKKINSDSNSAAITLRRYFKVFAEGMDENFRIATLNDVDPYVVFVEVV